MISKQHIIHEKLLLIVAIALLCSFSASATKGQDEVSTSFPYVFLLSDSTVVPSPVSDEDFYTHAHGVVFPVNKFSIPRDNPWLRELQEKVEPWAREQGLELRYIELRGAASPEGPLGWNATLAANRSASLRDTLQSIFAVNYDLISPTSPQHPEDYASLVYQMRRKNDPDRALVERIVKKNDNDRAPLKKELQSLRGGTLWKRLIKEYFPGIRAAKVVLYFRHKPMASVEKNLEPVPCSFAARSFTSEDAKRLQTMKTAGTVTTSSGILQAPDRIRRRELLSVKTNLVLDFAYIPFGFNGFCPIPNVAIEYYPLHGHFTYGAMFDCQWWKGDVTDHRYFQLRNYTLETRYYFRSGDVRKRGVGKGAAFKGMYLSAYANAAIYGIGWSERKESNLARTLDGHGWMGEGAGGGLGIGYVAPLGKSERWRLEFSAHFGLFWTKYDPYVYGCPVENVKDGLYYYDYKGDADLFKEREYKLTWIGPTRVGITLSYDLLYLLPFPTSHRRAGATFKAWEKGGSL